MRDSFPPIWQLPLNVSQAQVSFTKNVLVRVLVASTFLTLLLCFGLLSYFIHPSETPLVLHYNVYFGVDLLGIWWQVYMLPFLGVLFFIGHSMLARRFYLRSERIACYLMLFSSSLLSFGLLIACISIVFINY